MDGELLAWVVGTGLLIAVGAPGIFFAAADWKWAEQDAVGKRRMLRTILIVGLVFGTIGGVVCGVIAAVSRTGWLAAAGAVLLAIGLVVWNLRVAAPINRLQRIGRLLDDPSKREATRGKILRMVDTAPDDGVGASIRLGAATLLSNADFHADALRILQSIGDEGLDAHQKELRTLGLLDCYVQLHDLASARATLAQVPPLEPGGIHAGAYANMEALLLVLEGRPDEALARIPAAADHPIIERGRQGVLAHAFAARGDDSRRQACLLWLREHHGDEALARVVRHNGPASWHARELLNAGKMAYRA